MEIPLPWERLLWSGRSLSLPPSRYVLTDFRLVRIDGDRCDEIAIDDIGEIHVTRSWIERRLGTSTVLVSARLGRRAPLALGQVRRGPQLAALLELLSGDPTTAVDADAVRAALAWEPRPPDRGRREALAALGAVLIAAFAVTIGLRGTSAAIAFHGNHRHAVGARDAWPAEGRRRQRDV